ANQILLWFPIITIVLASLIALSKDNLKERLAYSTISQLSYIVLGALLATQQAVIGAGMHIAMHAFGKIALFFAA
ncbi:MAG TPA: cation:proton antiporter, partial [Glaciecola sp.]|nr:cation:proton antiporter [Glaciecola sp.]